MADNLHSTDIVPVHCPQCGEAQNTFSGGTDPLADDAGVGCMVCGYAFDTAEYRRLLLQRLQELGAIRIEQGASNDLADDLDGKAR